MELFPLGNAQSSPSRSIPLADRMRPSQLSEYIGQEHLLGEGKPLRKVIETGICVSMILWGPPGSGKTTLARLIARSTSAEFIEYSAVISGIQQIKEVVRSAELQLRHTGKKTILFVDEIHRFNKAQQDAFLPHIEKGTIILIGATTENPSFEVIPALQSRTRVFVLEALNRDHIESIIQRAISDPEHGLAAQQISISDDAIRLLADCSNGDARIALNTIEFACDLTPSSETGQRLITEHDITTALQRRPFLYDKSGEQHFNFISAFHKSLRGSDPDAALYWMIRMMEAGEDHRYLLRRMIRFAIEDVGLADPRALNIAISAKDSFEFLGSPEGDLALCYCAIYLATCPKSNRIYKAYGAVRAMAKDTPDAPVPMHLRNAPTQLMKNLGYGANYRYDHDFEDAISGQSFFPEGIPEKSFYEPTDRGMEAEIKRRMATFRTLRFEHRQSEQQGNRNPKDQ